MKGETISVAYPFFIYFYYYIDPRNINWSTSNEIYPFLSLKDLDTRIIIGSFSDEIAPKIFCEVNQ